MKTILAVLLLSTFGIAHGQSFVSPFYTSTDELVIVNNLLSNSKMKNLKEVEFFNTEDSSFLRFGLGKGLLYLMECSQESCDTIKYSSGCSTGYQCNCLNNQKSDFDKVICVSDNLRYTDLRENLHFYDYDKYKIE